MTHLEVEEELSAYLDGELSPELRAAVQVHLEACSACRTTLEELERTRALLAGLAQLGPSQNILPRVQHTIAQRSQGRFYRASGLRFPFEIVSGIVVLVLAILGLHSVADAPAGFVGFADLGPTEIGTLGLRPEAASDLDALRAALRTEAEETGVGLREGEGGRVWAVLPAERAQALVDAIRRRVPLRVEQRGPGSEHLRVEVLGPP